MNILFVSIAFPPKNDPECIQTGRFFKYLRREVDFAIDVVTSADPTLFMPVDESLAHLDQGFRQKIIIPIYESKLTNFMLRKIGMGSFLFPDSKMTFHWQSSTVLRRLKNTPDILYSRSNPISSAFMAAAIKRKLKVPWVMHLSDPWALSPLEEKSEKKLSAEARLIDEADHVTFTSEGTRQLYAAHYPGSALKFSVIPNVFDDEEVWLQEEESSEKFSMVYTGGLAGMRSLSFLDEVLTALQQRSGNMLELLDVIVAGPLDRTNKAYFERTPFKNIQHLGMLPYNVALKLQRRAHLLLVADNPTDSTGAIFFPSKLLDYFLTGKKILAVTPENSASREVLNNYPSACFKRDQTREIANFLYTEIDRWKRGQMLAPQAPPKQYAAKENAKLIAKLFRNILA